MSMSTQIAPYKTKSKDLILQDDCVPVWSPLLLNKFKKNMAVIRVSMSFSDSYHGTERQVMSVFFPQKLTHTTAK